MTNTLKLSRLAIGTVAMLGLAASANADVVLIEGDTGNSTEGLADFDGTIQYDFLGGMDGKLTVSLTNTSDLDNGGFLTGFVFNVGGFTVDLDLTSADYPFDLVSNESGSPFGTFAWGAALNGDFLGGGNPSGGIPVGDTGTFMFDLDSADAALISAMTFLTGDNDFNFLVRFRGFEDGGSDKVPARVVPTPGALALLGVAGIAAARRRRA